MPASATTSEQSAASLAPHHKRIVQWGGLLRFDADEPIFSAGDDAHALYRVASGVVRTFRFVGDGQRQIDAFHYEGDIFGFEATGRHSVAAEAVCRCTLFPHAADSIATQARTENKLREQLLSSLMRSLDDARDHAFLLACRSATTRVAKFVLQQADRATDGTIINLVVSRRDIGDYLALSVETVSRVFTELEREGAITLPRPRTIQISDSKRLRQLAH